MLGGNTKIVSDSGGASRLFNTLEGKICARESIARVVEHSEGKAQQGVL